MAEKEYISEITQHPARPRSRRLRELGAATTSVSGGGATVVISGSGQTSTQGDGHTHTNKRYLDQLSTDTDDYLYVTQYKDPTEGDEEAMVKTTEKVRAGQADEATHATSADEATHAQTAHDLDQDSPANDRFLRKDQDDRTEHSLGVGGSLDVDGEAHIGTNATVGGTATIEGDSNVVGNASVGGSQTVVGDSSVGGDQTVKGNQTVGGSSLIKGLLSLLTGAVSTDFLSGFLGTGFELRKNEETGRWRLEVDELLVRVVATFFELVISKLRHVGGSIVLTPASMQCVRVEETEDAYRCYFKASEGEKAVANEFVVGDQARCQAFNLKALDGGGVRTSFYWRLVTAVGDDWIALSKTDCAEGSDVPAVGDDIVQLGNRSDESRQNAIILDTTGSDAPSIKQYRGINGYALTDEMAMTIFSRTVNRIRGQFISEATGKDYDETMAAMGETVQSVKADMDAVKAQTDREFTIWFFDVDPTAENLPASDWTTDALKREHVEDIYYNRLAGHAWRWMAADDGSYSWADITDQESLRALEKASKAQDTADGKRRNFVSQPTDDDAYDVGDTWSNATFGDLYDNDTLVCVQAKAAGAAFSISHWQPASNATTAYIQNLGDEIRQVVADNKTAGDQATAAAQKAADDAAKAAANAQSIADAAKSAATANATAIVQTKDSISALSGKFTFDESGNVTNVKQSGVLMSADAASIYTKQETTNALGQRVTEAEAKIETSVQKDANGNIESSAKISADQITMNGTVKFATPSDVSTAKSEAISSASTDAQQKIQALKDALGELAYQNLISAAMLDETIISGGYIKTSLIDAVNLVVQNVRAVSADGETTCEINGATGKFTAKNAKLENCNVSGCITASSGQIGRLAIGSNGEMIGSNLNIENVATAGVISGETAITWLLVDHIKSSRTFILYAIGLESKAYTVWLPNINDVFGSWDYSLLIHGFMIYLFVPAVFSVLNMTESQNVATYRITPRSGCYMYNNSGSKISYIDLSKGDFVSLMGLVQCTNNVYRIDWYIHSLRQ